MNMRHTVRTCVNVSMIYQLNMYIFHFHTYFIRGHTVNAVCESFQGAKDAGFKVKRQNGMYVYVCLHNFQVVAHMMPDLPNVGLERDIEQFIVSN